MKEIPLTRGLAALVDDEDYEELSKSNWWITDNGYAGRTMPRAESPGEKMNELMHRVILGLARGDRNEVDHINHNRLDNQRGNLRICTSSENRQNSSRRRDNTSGYKGVSWDKHAKKWQAYIKQAGKKISLGYYHSPQVAHEAYCRAADRLYGEFAFEG